MNLFFSLNHKSNLEFSIPPHARTKKFVFKINLFSGSKRISLIELFFALILKIEQFKQISINFDFFIYSKYFS